MKKLFSSLMLTALLAIVSVNAIAQNSFNYQAVIRDGGTVLVNKTVNLRLSVMLDDKVYYSEQQEATTNAYGNVSVSVGEGTPLTGKFEDIPWQSMRVMLQVEVSTDGTDKYTNMGSMQIQPVPYAFYAARASVIQPAVASDEPIFQVKDNAGNLLFAVYETGVKVFVDDNKNDDDNSKAAKSKFAVAGRSANKGEETLLTINSDGTTVFVDDNDNENDNYNSKAAKSKFAVTSIKGKGEDDLLTIDGSGSTIYVGGEGKAAKSKFAVVGQSASKAGNNYSLDGDGSTVYVDFNNADKGAADVLTIDGAQATFYIDIDNDNKNDDYNQNGKAAKSRFAVVGVGANKDEQTAFVVDGSGTIIYIDDIDSNVEGASRFVVAGLTANNDSGINTNSDKFFTINRDSTRIYVNDLSQAVDTTGTEPGTTPVVTPSLASSFAIVGMTQKNDLFVVSKDSTIIKTDTYVAEEVQNSTGKVEKIIDDSKPKTIYTTGQIAAIALKGNDEVGESYNITYAYYQSDNGEYLHLKYCDNSNNYQYRNYYLIDNVLYADSIFMSSAVSEFAIAPEHYTQPVKSDTSLVMVYERKMRNNGYSSFLEDGQTTFYDSEENLVMTTEHNVLMAVDNGMPFIDTTLQNILVQGMIKAGGASYERNDFVKLQLSNGQLYDNATDFDNCNEDVFGSEEERNKLTVAQIESWFAALKAGFAVKGLANNDVYGEVRFSENKERYAYGETLTLTADAKEGYVFTCWSDGYPDKERSVIVAGEASYQAIFEQPVLYVSGSKNAKNENYGFTIAEPLATLAAAASIIVEAEPTDLKWTIRIDSAVTGSQTLPADLNDHASSITIEGYRGINRDGVPQDTLNGNSEGTTLAINTAVPVTIENLMITGGNATNGANGGGINIASGATVTLADGARVSGNKSIRNESNAETGCGGGVYNLGTLFMYGSAVIGDNTKQVAATSEGLSNQAARGAGLFNQKGAKAYLGYSSENQKAELTGGIFYNFNAANNFMEGAGVFNRGTLKMNSGTIAYNGSNSSGVGVYNEDTNSGYFELSGGKISNNKSIGNPNWGGGGVRSATAFVMTGGEISDNYTNCTCDGSGVFLEYPFTMTGGVIKGNGPKTDVSFHEDATFSMGGSAVISGTVSYNKVVTICKPFDDTLTLAATINPSTYANNRTVLVLADSVKKSTTLATEVGKFKLASADWRIIADGKMLKSDFVSVQGTYFDGSAAVANSDVFIEGRKLAIQNLYVCDHEVTQGEYVAVMGTNPSNNPSGDNYPVEQVSWLGAINYCNSRSAVENLTQCYTIDNNTVTCNFDANGYRLPTEAEWEYLARGGELTGPQMAFSGSSSPDGVAWYSGNSGNKTHEVKTKEKNTLDLYDMCGNVWEWCWDYYNSITSSTPATGPESANANYHCERGGWYGTSSEYCEVGNRQSNAPTYVDSRSGFRIVRTAVITDSVTITFNTNDGEAVEPMKVWRGYRHNELPTPKKGTLNFGGWYIDSDCQIPFVVGGAIISDTTLYAKWLSDFIEVPGTYFDGAEAMANSVVFVKDSQIVIRDLYACDHEVTQREWYNVMNVPQEQLFAADSGRGPNYPVYNISWYDAIAYCNKLSVSEHLDPVYTVNGVDFSTLKYADIPTANNADWNAAVADYDKNGYRLPTEAEWEYLARGGSNWDSYQYSGSNSIDSVAWNNYNSAVNGKIKMHEVKTKKANSLGLYDMSGSAWEWCSDWMDDASLNVRGGSVKCNPLEYSHNDWCNVKSRGGNAPYDKTWHFGFRVVRTATNTDTVTITFDTKGGDAMEPMKVWKGYRLNAPTPKNGTLNFGGWYLDSNCQTPFDYHNAITSDITLYANWLSNFIEVPGTYFDGSTTIANSVVFIEGRKFPIRDLLVCEHEVTQAEYEAIMKSNPSEFKSNAAEGETQANRPVEMVSWYDALVYCNLRSIAEGLKPVYSIKGDTLPANWGAVPTEDNADWNEAVCNFDANGYRLPTEAEWEYAARGGSLSGTQYTYSGSDSFSPVAWCQNNSGNKTHEVKKKQPNTIGLFDMSGNVWEWCFDWSNSISTNTSATGPESAGNRIVRGGAFDGDYETTYVYNHDGSHRPYIRVNRHGIRLVRTTKPLYAMVGSVLCNNLDETVAAIAAANSSVEVTVYGGVSANDLGSSLGGGIIGAIKNNNKTDAKFSLVITEGLNLAVTNCEAMFFGCTKLVSADLRGLNTDGVTTMSNMFNGCSALTSIDMKGLNTDNVSVMKSMFMYCSALESLDISIINTDNVETMEQMFLGCSKLKILDLSNFSFSKVTNAKGMFRECSELTTIYTESDVDLTGINANNLQNMFRDCNKLIGGNGTAYSNANGNGTHARVDKDGQEGYFTDIHFSYEGKVYKRYKISTTEDFNRIFATRKYSGNNIYLSVENDLTVDGVKYPNEYKFYGVFNGNGHTITIKSVNSDGKEFCLFNFSNYGIIQNMKVQLHESFGGVVVANPDNAPVYSWFLGVLRQNAEGGVIRNCWSTMSAKADVINCMGGIASGNKGLIENCVNTGNIEANFTNYWGGCWGRTGGICGDNDATIRNCVNYGTIKMWTAYNDPDLNLIGIPGAISSELAQDTTKNEYCYWLDSCVVANINPDDDPAPTNFMIYNDDRVRNGSASGCGYFSASGTITAGLAEHCKTDQTLKYGTDLLSALNNYVAEQHQAGNTALAQWKPVSGKAAVLDLGNATSFYVDPADGLDNNDGTKNYPVRTLGAALALMNNSETDYVVRINGQLTGPQALGDTLNSRAAHITLEGARGLNNGVPQDVFNGNDAGTALTIATTVPVEIRNLQITGGNNSNGNGGGLYIGNSVNVTLENGALIGNNTPNVATSDSYGNKATVDGGGVYVDGGTLILKSGSIVGYNYVANHGGGVFVADGGKLYIESGAKIVYNYGLDEAGGVWIEESAMAEMTGGEISHNAALTFAGGIEIMGTFTMSGGTISYNEVTDYVDGNGYAGGGAFIGPKGVFNMTGTASIICNKTRGCQGGAVKVAHETGTFRMTGGIIQGNTATECASGGGVRVESSNFLIGDSAFIASDNVVQLIEIDDNNPGHPYKVNIISPLTKEYAVTILPQNYTADVQVLQLANNATTNLEAECGKFAVMPVVSGTTSTSWYVNNTGYLQQGQSHMFVDLGLTSGNLWATCNVGATNPQDYGDYFAWGETETYYSSLNSLVWKEGKGSGYAWASYTKLSGGSQNTFKKYNRHEANGTVDNKNDLDPVDDAATANWGFGWAMPTNDDCQELIDECYWVWTTYNGVKGYIVYKSFDKKLDHKRTKSSSYTYSTETDAHIFIPAAGGFGDNPTQLGNTGANGFYWTASLYEDGVSGSHLNFGDYAPYTSCYPRVDGFPVRPVKKH